MRRLDVEAKLVDEALQPGHLALWYLHHQPRQRRRVDDRMLEWTLQPPTHEPRVKRVVAVLHEHRALGEPHERAPRVLEHRRADEHRAVDVVALLRVGVDRRAAVHERVEERERLRQREALGAKLEDEKRRVAGRLDVERNELGIVERRERSNLRRVDRDLLPGHRLHRAARLQEDGLGGHRASSSARRAHAISSVVTARSSRTATP